MHGYILRALALLMVSTSAQANTVYCVATPQELRIALADAANGPDGIVDVRLRAGTYGFGADPTPTIDVAAVVGYRLISVSGGWIGDAATCQARIPGALATVIDAGGQGRGLYVELGHPRWGW